MSHRTLPGLALGLAATLAVAAPALAHPQTAPVSDADAAAHTLAEQHKHHLKLDGKLGPLTEAMIRRFQKTHGIKVDGIIGTETRKMLGLKPGAPLRPGMVKEANEEIRTAQHILSHHEHIWHEADAAEAKPAAAKPAAPIARPAAPVAAPAAKPVEPWTAAPSVAPAPTPEPWKPAPATPAAPTATDDRPFLVVYGGNWFLPKFSSAYDFDWGLSKPAYMGGLQLWSGDWGLAGEVTNMPAFFVERTQVLAPATMADAQLTWRDDDGANQLGFGYRNVGGNHLGTLAYGFELPLVGDTLALKGGALGGTNLGTGWMADGRVGLGLGFGAVQAEAGWRALGLSGFAGTSSLVWTQAPYGTIGLRF
ncbi:MAG: peptidoglycan-binding domain-containing protein [Candidatus Sericytochromatia bacterium]|nr:peptidoglycan-binding domain-containing protein [Candidatus Sericytochromatia bacterium]